MIDEKTLAEYESRSLEHGCTGNAEILRLARRYLALRENEIAILTAAVNGFDADTYRAEYDAAADRLLEGGR